MNLFSAMFNDGRRWARIGDSYEVTNKPRDLDIASLKAIPFAPMDCIPAGGQYGPKFILRPPSEIKSGTYFERGDILMAKITPSFENGKQALVTDLPTAFGYATTEVIPLRPRAAGHDPRLLFYYLLHPVVRHYLADRMEGTTGRQRVPQEVLLDTKYPEFEPEEQAAIAECLETIQQMIAVEEASAQATTILKRVSASKLFRYGLRGEPQRDSELGPLPASWDVISFRSVRNGLQYGTSARCTYQRSNHPVLRIPNIEPQRINPDDLKYSALSDTEVSKYMVNHGDLIFIRTNGVLDRLGSCAVYSGKPPNALFASYLIRASLRRERVLPRFLSFYFGSEAGHATIASRASQASDGKYNLNRATLDTLPLPLPRTLEEQSEIVKVLSGIDSKNEFHRRKRSLLVELFIALLHKLMIGEVCVVSRDEQHRVTACR